VTAEDRPEPERYTAERVRERLRHDPRVMELGVEVKLVGMKVFIDGPISTEQQRAAVDEIVSEMLPDYEVHNQTTVGPMQEAEEAERLT
jgi:osmotically-inducible protein OsmY